MNAARIEHRWRRTVLLGLVAAAALASALFALRTYRTFELLQSARAAGAPQVSSIRAWMTLRYIADHYHVPQAALHERLALSPPVDPDTSLKALAEERRVSRFGYVQQVQRAVANIAPAAPPEAPRKAGWLSVLNDQTLAALLVYGYPVLALILLVGAIGLPVPTGLSTAVAGSLASNGSMSWVWATIVAVAASVVGDMIGYGVGRALNRHALERGGRWIGYTPARRERVERLFERLGGVTVFLTRTLVSHLSSVVNLLAGASRYALGGFLAFTIIGRLVWTSAYLGLGYAVGTNLEAAASFLGNLSFLLVSLGVLAAAAFFAWAR
jgi:membrane-associated protein